MISPNCMPTFAVSIENVDVFVIGRFRNGDLVGDGSDASAFLVVQIGFEAMRDGVVNEGVVGGGVFFAGFYVLQQLFGQTTKYT